MASLRNVFLLGAGYVGRNILDDLVAAKYSVTTLVRRPEQAPLLQKAGANTILGTLDDLELLTEQAAKHEIIINTTISDDLASVEALLSGVRQRVNTNKPVIYIHTSGAGCFEDGALGMHSDSHIYRDDDPETVDAVSPASLHRHVDIVVAQAARELRGKAKIVISLPPLLYGWNPTHNRHSFVLTALVGFALKHGFAGYVGEGRNVWSVIHIADLGRAYKTMVEHIERSNPEEFADNPYFFAENGAEVSMGDTARHIAKVLHDMGKIQSPAARTLDVSHYPDVFGADMTPRGLGSNSKTRAIRLREVGWECTEKDIWASWKDDEIPALMAALESESK